MKSLHEKVKGAVIYRLTHPVDIKTKVRFWPVQVRPGQAKTELFILMLMGGLAPCIALIDIQ